MDALRYWGWKELIKDLSDQHIKVMTYCNPCLAPVMLLFEHLLIIKKICSLTKTAGETSLI